MESFEYQGTWWLPENPKNKVQGTLKFDPKEGAFLDLIGSFKDVTQLTTSLEPVIILGIAEGKILTLYRCYESRSRLNVPGTLNTSFWVSFIFVGCHFNHEEDIVFNNLSVNYSHLAEWTWITGFKFKIEADSKKQLKEYGVTYSFPEIISAKIGNLEISLEHGFKDGGDRIEEYHLKQTTFIKIKPEFPLHFNRYQHDMLYHIQNFLSLGIGKAAYPLVLNGKSEHHKRTSQDGKIIYEDIGIYYSIRDIPDMSKRLHPLDMFFSFSDISSEFEKCLNNWFGKAEILKPVYDLYFAILYSSKMYLQHQFLSLTQALEAYHRRVHGGKYVSDEDYSEIYGVLINAIPGKINTDFRDSLKRRLQYHNEFALRKRFKEVFEKCGDVTSFLISNPDNFIEDVVNARNFLTHYDKSLEAKAKDGNELYGIVERTKFLLEICFLMQLEMPMDKIKTLVSRNQRYQHLARQG